MLFIWPSWVFIVAWGFFFFFQLPHVGSNFLIRNGIWAPCIGYVESQPLDYQGIPVETTVDYKTSLVISVPTSQTSVSWGSFSLVFSQLPFLSYKPELHHQNFHHHINGKRNGVTSSSVQFSSVQSLSYVRLFATPWITAHQASLSITNSWSSLKLTSIEAVLPSSHLILCCPLLLLIPIPPSIRVFSNESTLHMRWPKYWRFSLSISPSNEHPGLISFRMDWLGLSRIFSNITVQKHQFFGTQLSSQSNSHVHTWPLEKP